MSMPKISFHFPRRIFTSKARSSPFSTLFAIRTNPFSSTPYRSNNDSRNDILVRIFDDPLFHSNSHLPLPPSRPSNSIPVSVGLFNIPAFATPADFLALTQRAIDSAEKIVVLITQASSLDDKRAVVKRLDLLSETLCSVLDAAEVIRNVHQDAEFVNAAVEVHQRLSTYLNQLNTHLGLYNSLREVISNKEFTSDMNEEELKVGKMFLSDFEKSGIDLPLHKRAAFVKLNQKIQTLGFAFSSDSSHNSGEVVIHDPEQRLSGLPSQWTRSLLQLQKDGRLMVPIESGLCHILLSHVENEEVRRDVFVALNKGTLQQKTVLEDLLKARKQLATLLGKKSYSELFLIDKMAKTPDRVMAFLEKEASQHRRKAKNALQQLEKLKGSRIFGWDKDFYLRKWRGQQKWETPGTSHISEYITVGGVFYGLSQLFQRLYGISLIPEHPKMGETWHSDVRKLQVVHETEGLVGVIYCDLFQRPQGANRKFDQPAHFTVRCSRRVDDDKGLGPDWVHATKVTRKGKVYQLPIVVLVCNFRRPNPTWGPTTLGLSNLETLFHEMGHAMHSMLARTDFQHVAGTRCQHDLVETPSILMELFANSPQVLQLFAKHKMTNAQLPMKLLEWEQQRQSISQTLERQSQLTLAMLDQVYHSDKVPSDSGRFCSSAILQDLQDKVDVIPYVPGTSMQTQFKHLDNYGAGYYSYFFSRAFALRIWEACFSKERVLSRKGGELFREELLRWGGARDGWESLKGILLKANHKKSEDESFWL